MLPKYLPPKYSDMFNSSVSTADNELSIKEAFRFVHDMIGYFEEKEGMEPLDALEQTYKVICRPS